MTWRDALARFGQVGPARRVVHRLSVRRDGFAVAFLRVRRLVPSTAKGAAHPDRARGTALFPQELSAALETARAKVTFVPLVEALDILEAGKRLTRGLAVLTFDESFAVTAELALPICRALGIPATFFVTTGPLDDEEPTTLWDTRVDGIVEAMGGRPLSTWFVDRPLPTATPVQRRDAARRLVLSLASLDEKELVRRLHELETLAGGPVAVGPLDRMLNATELAGLVQDPHVSVGAHGRTHVALATVSSATLADEFASPRDRLLALAKGAFVDVASYPFGRAPYLDDNVVQAARHAGYRAAFTAVPGLARSDTPRFALPRLALSRRRSIVSLIEETNAAAALVAWRMQGKLVDQRRGEGLPARPELDVG